MIRRFDFYYFLSLGLLSLALFGVPTFTHPHQRAKLPSAMPRERLASHAIWYKDPYGGFFGLCSGTAIGPHSIITAAHCNEKNQAAEIALDESTETHKILAVTGDGHDHEIYLLDGTPFTNIEPFKQAMTFKMGETVTIFGDGARAYPPVPKYGAIQECEDPSDVDAAAGEHCTSIHVVPGDSGSAIYNVKGEIIGLVTYQDTSTSPSSEAGFATHFSPEVLEKAKTFNGTDEDLPGRPKPIRSPFDLYRNPFE